MLTRWLWIERWDLNLLAFSACMGLLDHVSHLFVVNVSEAKGLSILFNTK